MPTKVWSTLTYLIVGILALWLTTISTRIERDSGRVEGGFPFVTMADNPANPTARGSLNIDDYVNMPGILANIVVYGVIVLTTWRLMQSVYTQQLHPSLSYLLPCATLAGLCFVVGSMGYNPFPLPPYIPQP